MKTVLLTMFCLFINLLTAQDYTAANGVEYTILTDVSPNSVAVSGLAPEIDLMDYMQELTIPNSVIINNINYSVIAISDSAIRSRDIMSLFLPNSIISIGAYAFADNYIENPIHLPNVTFIGEYAFKNNWINDLSLPIIESIGNSFQGNPIINLSLPNVQSIGNHAFQSHYIENLSLPNVQYIGDYAFEARDAEQFNINTLNLPNVQSIGAYAFKDNSIQDLSLPSLQSIGHYAFQNNNIESLDLPIITDIGDSSFRECSITNLNLPSVISIGAHAFALNNISELFLPNVRSIGSGAFSEQWNVEGNELLTSVELPNVITIEPYAFIRNDINYINLPNVQSIGQYAFMDNKLISFELPSSIQFIGERAFAFNQELEIVKMNSSNPPSIFAESVFEKADGSGSPALYYDMDLYIPIGTTELYISRGWTAPVFNTIVESFLNLTNIDIIVPENGTYTTGQNLEFEIIFDRNIYITGFPYIAIDIDNNTREATYTEGSATNNIKFGYTIQSTDEDEDGITIGSLVRNGGTIQDNLGTSVDLSIANKPDTSGIIINYIEPTYMPIGVGINTENPQTTLDVVGGIRALNRDVNGNLYECNSTIEGTIGYNTVSKEVEVCTDRSGDFMWEAF